MLTIEKVKTEYFRVEKKLKKEAINQTAYSAYCKDGYSPHMIKKELGLTYNAMKKIIGAKPASTLQNGGKTLAKKKIYCARGYGKMISIDECVPGCTPEVCSTCKSKQKRNIKASDDILTPEEEKVMRLEGMIGGGMGRMIEETISWGEI